MKATKRILIVDDEVSVLGAIKDTLGGYYDMVTASNGREALKIAEKERPDLILMDIMMPEMDGLETIKEIRKNDDLRMTPVILLTARGQLSDIEKGLDVGAYAYIVKPFHTKRLIEKVKEVFSKLETLRKSNREN
jgi:two-component system alkaline phosphatase synthesis response regulator PhoP